MSESINLTDAVATQGLPAGEYLVTCVESEIKSTQDGTGKYVKVKFAVDDSPMHIFHMFNFQNKSEKATTIGRNQLKAFLTVAGYPDPNNLKDVWEMVNLRCRVKVKIESDEYGDKPRITVFKPLEDVKPEAAPAAKKNPF